MPWFIGPEVKAGLCVSVPPDTDTSRWRLAITVDEHRPQPGFKTPSARRGTVLCTNTEQAFTREGAHALCAAIIDDYDGATRSLPCQNIYVSPHDDTFAAATSAIEDLLRDSGRPGIATEFVRLAATTGAQQLPITALRSMLIAAHFERRDAGLEAQTDYLSVAPSWLDDTAAYGIAAQFYYERAMIALLKADLRAAWHNANIARQRFRAIAHPKTIVAATRRAQILLLAGAADEARADLARSIEVCARQDCDAALLRNARSTLAWWLMHDDASSAELAQAGELLADALEDTQGVERANALLNQAWLATHLDQPTMAKLDEVDHLLSDVSGQRAAALRNWRTFLLALYARRSGNSDQAMTLLERIASPQTELATRIHSMRGHLLREAGRPEQAARHFAMAVSLHGETRRHDLRIPMTRGQRAADHYALALTAVDRGAPTEAWTALAMLDNTAVGPMCPRVPSNAITHRLETLYATLNSLRGPVSAQRQRQRTEIRTELLLEQRALLRSTSRCDVTLSVATAEPDLRAFFYDDTVVVLSRDEAGEVHLARRSQFDHDALATLIETIANAQTDSAMDDQQWRLTTSELAQALLPPADMLAAPRTHVALHGPLQRIPLGALPFENGWLADTTTIVLTPSGPLRPYQHDPQRSTGTVVIDPSENFASADDSREFFARDLPSVTLISGRDASIERVVRATGEARWLHIDAHGALAHQFADLYALRMTDGLLFSSALTQQAAGLEFANLSSCQSGAFPLTADSGQWGLAGDLAEAGVPWVIAARHDLNDQAAAQFNRDFYSFYQDGLTVPAAYRGAHARLRDAFPARIWAALILVGHPGGQSDQPRTPHLVAQPVLHTERAPVAKMKDDD